MTHVAKRLSPTPPSDLHADTPWRARAACKDMDLNRFYPTRGDKLSVIIAKEACNSCPVRMQCLEEHLEVESGIFGGMTERDRRSYARKVKKAEAAGEPPPPIPPVFEPSRSDRRRKAG